MNFVRRLHASPLAPALARRSLDALTESVDRERLDDLRLIVSELVTNSVTHSGLGDEGWIEMKIEMLGEGVRVEVSDFGAGFAGQPVRPTDEGGRGFVIVDHLADRWGREWGPPTTVWAEVAVPDRPPSGRVSHSSAKT